jgi:hypothetical protein
MQPNDVPNDHPVPACTLSGTDARERRQWLGAVMRRATETAITPQGVTAQFAYSDVLERHLRAIAMGEAECCPFLQIEISRDEEHLRLTVSGPTDAMQVIGQMFRARPQI